MNIRSALQTMCARAMKVIYGEPEKPRPDNSGYFAKKRAMYANNNPFESAMLDEGNRLLEVAKKESPRLFKPGNPANDFSPYRN